MFAAGPADGQIRLFLHLQGGDSAGLAALLIMPDATLRPNRVYGEAGYLIRKKDAEHLQWAEFLVGAFVRSDHAIEPALDSRFLFRRIGEYTGVAQAFYNLATDLSLVQLNLVFDLPLRGWQLGAESDITHSRGRTVASMGPRLAYAPTKHLALALGFQFRPNNQDICRSYSGLNFFGER